MSIKCICVFYVRILQCILIRRVNPALKGNSISHMFSANRTVGRSCLWALCVLAGEVNLDCRQLVLHKTDSECLLTPVIQHAASTMQCKWGHGLPAPCSVAISIIVPGPQEASSYVHGSFPITVLLSRTKSPPIKIHEKYEGKELTTFSHQPRLKPKIVMYRSYCLKSVR